MKSYTEIDNITDPEIDITHESSMLLGEDTNLSLVFLPNLTGLSEDMPEVKERYDRLMNRLIYFVDYLRDSGNETELKVMDEVIEAYRMISRPSEYLPEQVMGLLENDYSGLGRKDLCEFLLAMVLPNTPKYNL